MNPLDPGYALTGAITMFVLTTIVFAYRFLLSGDPHLKGLLGSWWAWSVAWGFIVVGSVGAMARGVEVLLAPPTNSEIVIAGYVLQGAFRVMAVLAVPLGVFLIVAMRPRRDLIMGMAFFTLVSIATKFMASFLLMPLL